MDEILEDLSASKLAIAIEDNLISWMPVFGKAWRLVEDDPQGIKRSVCPVPLSLFNSIMDTHISPENVDAVIQFIKSDAELRRVPVLWWLGPSTSPNDLGVRLKKSGFLIGDDDPGMAIDLCTMKEDLPWLDGLDIVEVSNDNLLWDWCSAMSEGNEIPPDKSNFFTAAWHDFISQVSPDQTIAYLAKWFDKPVASSILQLGGGVAGIYAVATIPSARRKGIGARITQYPLQKARSLGFKAGVLGASEMGYGVYRSLGFKEYCHISSYIYRPTPS